MEEEGESNYISSIHNIKKTPILNKFSQDLKKMSLSFTPIVDVLHQLFDMFTTTQTHVIATYID